MKFQAQRIIGYASYADDYEWEPYEQNDPTDYRVKVHAKGPIRASFEDAQADIAGFPGGDVDLRTHTRNGFSYKVGTGVHPPLDVVVVIED